MSGSNVAAQDNTSASAATSDSGDFGEGIGSLEEQLLNSIPEDGESTEQPQGDEGQGVQDAEKNAGTQGAITTSTPSAGAGSATPQSLFDLNGKLSVKAGESLTADHVKELERGFLREADYTRKTQEVSKLRNEAQDILNIQKRAMEDPRTLFDHIPPAKLLSAFTRQEMLNHGLRAGGVKPEVWNTFIKWFREGGADGEGEHKGELPPQADPNANHISELARRLEATERRFSQVDEQKRIEAETREKESQIAAYDREVDTAVAEFPGVKPRRLLAEMAASDGTKSIREIAQELHSEKEREFQEYLKTKQQQRGQTVKAPKGASVPVARKAPKTFEEVDEMVAKMYGEGTLNVTNPFGR